MIRKKLFILIVSIFFISINTPTILAGNTIPNGHCFHNNPDDCVTGYSCQQDPKGPALSFICLLRISTGQACELTDPDPCTIGDSCQQVVGGGGSFCESNGQPAAPPAQPGNPTAAQPNPVGSAFGTITPPLPIAAFIGADPTGVGGISKFLSNLIALIYSIAAIVIIFMLVWGAFDWITSEGDKEKIASARNKIMSALIGFMLFGITFAIISVLGTFTGFTFFKGN